MDDVVTGAGRVPEGFVGNYVEWVVHITGPSQQIVMKNTLGDCMELMTGQSTNEQVGDDIEMPEGPTGPNERSLEYLYFWPDQPDAVVTIEGNMIYIENIEIPPSGTLEIRYWAKVVGMAHIPIYRDPPRILPVGTASSDVTPAMKIEPVGTPTNLGIQDRFTDQFASGQDFEVRVDGEYRPKTAIITHNICCNQVKVVGEEEVRLVESQGPNETIGLCPNGGTGFRVRIPNAPVEAPIMAEPR
jgi:hypothetical protein